MSPQRLLIVHPDASVRALLVSMLRTLGHPLDEAPNERAAVRMLEGHPADAILAGAEPQGPDGDADTMEFVTYLRRKFPGVPVLLLSSEPRPDRTREALARGARSVLRFPMPAVQLRAAVSQALESAEPRPAAAPASAEGSSQRVNGSGRNGSHAHPAPPESRPSAVATPPADRHDPYATGEEIVGEDPALAQALELIEVIAPARAPVLIVGEAGTGKALLARRLHRRGPRRDGPFVEVACSALSESALEAELFGRRGSGAGEPDRPGRVAQAHGGTLYLDEVASLAPGLQFKLLRLLRDGQYEPVGSTQTAVSDCRVVVGSREDLQARVADDRFRADLFYTLSVVTMKLPPLRHRGRDVIRLAEFFRDRAAREAGRPPGRFSPEATHLLESHHWPGNVPELRSTVERAVLLARGREIEPSHLVLSPRTPPAPARPSAGGRSAPPRSILPLKEALEGPEKQLILEALQALNWNRQETARVLDINRTTLYKKMKKYGLLYDEPVWTN